MTAILLTPKAPLPLGEFLSSAGLVRPAQVKYALDLQRATGEKLGEVLVRQGALDPRDIAAAVEVQHQVREHLAHDKGKATHTLPDCLSVGELLVARGDVSRAVLNQALQNAHKGAELGEVLVKMGVVKPETLSHVLPLQKRLLSAVLCAGLGFAFAFSAQTAKAAGGGSSRLLITATVAKTIQVTIKSHPAGFTVTEQDIARGYLDVAQQTLFEVKTNSPDGIALEFHGVHNGGVIQTVQITGGAGGFQMPASGGIMLIQGSWHPTAKRSFSLQYRLVLGPNAQPGTHAWPFTMGVSAL